MGWHFDMGFASEVCHSSFPLFCNNCEFYAKADCYMYTKFFTFFSFGFDMLLVYSMYEKVCITIEIGISNELFNVCIFVSA